MKKRLPVHIEPLAMRLLNGDVQALSKFISLVESNLETHKKDALSLMEWVLPHTEGSIRIGISGVPGVGKSTFIEALGLLLITEGKKVAVLTIDPSSKKTGGSILGDKTRMSKLAASEQAFIRPSATANTLGGVAQNTRNSILLCEAAGYNIVLVETVGVGQNELAVHHLVDFFLLLKLPGAGDEIQGIKRGIMEVADALLINKADGASAPLAKQAQQYFKTALHAFKEREDGWEPPVLLASAIENRGILEAWQTITAFINLQKKEGYFKQKRAQQKIKNLHTAITEALLARFNQEAVVQKAINSAEKNLLSGAYSIEKATEIVINTFLNTPLK